LRKQDYVASGPRSLQPGAPYTYVTTAAFLSDFGFASLRELPDMDKLEEAGLLSRNKLLSGDPLAALTADGEDDDPSAQAEDADEPHESGTHHAATGEEISSRPA